VNEMRKRNRRALLCLAVLILCLAVYLAKRSEDWRRDYLQAEDLVSALACFAVLNGGRLPASEQEFTSSPVATRLPSGGAQLHKPAGDRFFAIRGDVIPNLAAFGIAWGHDLTGLRLGDRFSVHDPEGREITLIKVSLPGVLGKVDRSVYFSQDLLASYLDYAKRYTTTTQTVKQAK